MRSLALLLVALVLGPAGDKTPWYGVGINNTGSPPDAAWIMRLVQPIPPGRVEYFGRIPAVEPEHEAKERWRRAPVKSPRWFRDGWEVGVHESWKLGPILIFEVLARPKIELVGRRRPSGLYVNAWCGEIYAYVDCELWLIEEYPEYGGRYPRVVAMFLAGAGPHRRS
jgi:hypothetical protein